jgi:hypothetical protein
VNRGRVRTDRTDRTGQTGQDRTGQDRTGRRGGAGRRCVGGMVGWCDGVSVCRCDEGRWSPPAGGGMGGDGMMLRGDMGRWDDGMMR